MIRGNVIAYGETNVEIINNNGPSSNISVVGNFLLNPRGPYPRGQQVQINGSSNVTVLNNYMLSALSGYLYPENQEDAVNLNGNGGSTSEFLVQGNYIVGGHSPSGCGISMDNGSTSGSVKKNILSNTGQCGIGVSDGVAQVVDSNEVLNLNPVSGAGNQAVYVNLLTNTPPCGGSGPPNWITVSNNIADLYGPPIVVTHNATTIRGNCGTVNLFGNTFGLSAYRILYAMVKTNPPPLIPPQPYSCVIPSPYSTQTSKPACKN